MDSPGSRALPDNLWSARDLYGDVYHLCSSWVGILAMKQDVDAYHIREQLSISTNSPKPPMSTYTKCGCSEDSEQR